MDELDIIVAQERYHDMHHEAKKWQSAKNAGFTPYQPW
ncbi:MAG: hypothetical protein GFH27_549291n276 [Chloroflexi bacterium AL-W]|nr:hypothetical protein [Chloroflexi bacterium AL-N1]NOK67256.1 hypothetical protein [Chloroflexi bacterium AL-N10]NOK75250.1 hypothetical protein [Chloroflexi bacterium AL-N5]NOK82038.1 hypothetical protein [Chloroflexi bacterium AL-W]NOK89883.1 hypothetical protein [Chloroflexi bacterium AL-N15]